MAVVTIRLLALLPLRVLYLISGFLFFVLYYLTGYRRKVVDENLRRAYPEKTENERKAIARKFYRNLADIIMEIVKINHFPEKEIRKRISVRNKELLEKFQAENRKIVAIQGHYGNWEWSVLISGLIMDHKKLGIYKPLSNKIFDKLFIHMRSSTGMEPVPMNESLRTLIKYRNEPFSVGIIADQTPSNLSGVYWGKFLNQDTPVFVGIEKIATQFNAAIIFFHMERVKRGYYELQIDLLTDDPGKYSEYELTRMHVQYLEERINQHPENWLWSHRRWKHKPGEEDKIKFKL